MSGSNQRSAAGKKKGGGFLSRQAKSKGDKKPPISEEELLLKDVISPDDILSLKGVSESECFIFYSNFLYY